MTHDHPDHEIDPDIQETLAQVRGEQTAGSGDAMPASDGTAAVTHSNPACHMMWGLKSAMTKTMAVAREHPWWACLGLVASVASSVFVCSYCGWILLGGLMIYAIRRKS